MAPNSAATIARKATQASKQFVQQAISACKVEDLLFLARPGTTVRWLGGMTSPAAPSAAVVSIVRMEQWFPSTAPPAPTALPALHLPESAKEAFTAQQILPGPFHVSLVPTVQAATSFLSYASQALFVQRSRRCPPCAQSARTLTRT